jgi:hypothetical protein
LEKSNFSQKKMRVSKKPSRLLILEAILFSLRKKKTSSFGN